MRPLFLTWLYMDYACAKHVQLLIKQNMSILKREQPVKTISLTNSTREKNILYS